MRNFPVKIPEKSKDIKDIFVRRIFGIYRSTSRQRKINFRLTLAQFSDLVKRNCIYCNAPPGNKHSGDKNKKAYRGKSLIYQGLDRMDSSKGYVISNVVPCCRKCNMIKGNALSFQEMLEVARLIKKLRGDFTGLESTQQQLVPGLPNRLVTTLLRKSETPQES